VIVPKIFALAALLGSLGCLPSELFPQGVHVAAGRDIEKPDFVTINEQSHLIFQRRTSRAAAPRSGTYDVWLAPWGSAEPRRLIAQVADRSDWAPGIDAAGVRYYMTNETVLGGPPPSGSKPVGELTRVDLARGVLERIPGVLNYRLHGAEWLYWKGVSGQDLSELHFRGQSGVDRVLGLSNGDAQVFGPERIYFVAGEDKTLSRITAVDGPVEPLRSHVTRFLIRPDHKLAIVTVLEQKTSRTLVLDLVTRMERAVPGDSLCCWRGFSGPIFVYAESASGAKPGKLHSFNTDTHEDRVLVLPPGLADVSAILPRPRSGEALFLDSPGQLARYQPPDTVRVLGIRPLAPAFSADGRYLIYIEPDLRRPTPPGGRLMVWDAEYKEPARVLSPPGTVVPDPGYFFIDPAIDPNGVRAPRPQLAFWARFGHAAPDLYFAEYETGDIRVVARGIQQLSVTSKQITGIVRVSQQDLVGDLIDKDLMKNEEQVLASQVSDAVFFGPQVAFIVRERASSPHDGLWATCLGPEGPARRNCFGP
jgi:hypothetical protein